MISPTVPACTKTPFAASPCVARGRQAAEVEARAVAELRERAEHHVVGAGGARGGARRLAVGRRLRDVRDARDRELRVLLEARRQHVGDAALQVVRLLERVDDDREHGDHRPAASAPAPTASSGNAAATRHANLRNIGVEPPKRAGEVRIRSHRARAGLFYQRAGCGSTTAFRAARSR